MAIEPAFERAVEALKRDPRRPVRLHLDALEVELRVVGSAPQHVGTRLAALGPWEGESEAELVERLRAARAAGGSGEPPEL